MRRKPAAVGLVAAAPVRKARPVAKPSRIPPDLLDDPAVKAMLDWHDRGRPQGEIVTDADAPALTQEQLRAMRPARFRIGKR